MSTAPTPASIDADLSFAIRAAHAAGQRLLSLREQNRWEDVTLDNIFIFFFALSINFVLNRRNRSEHSEKGSISIHIFFIG